MHMRFLLMSTLWSLEVFGQTYQFQPLPLPPQAAVILGISTTSTGTLQVAGIFANSTYLMAQSSPGSALSSIGQIYANGFRYKLSFADGEGSMWGFSQQNGNVSYIGDGSANGFPYTRQHVLTRLVVSSPSLQAVCTGYTFNGTAGNLPAYWRGPTIDNADNIYFSATKSDHGSSLIYMLKAVDIPATAGVCRFTSVAQSDREVLQAFHLADGRFIAQRVISASPIDWTVTDIALIDNNMATVLVSNQPNSNPQILASGHSDLIWDRATETGLITYNTPGAGHYLLFQEGKLTDEKFDSNIRDLGSSYVRGVDIKGSYALVGVGDVNEYQLTSMMAINLFSKTSTVVLSKLTQLPGGFTVSGFGWGGDALGANGTVYVTARNSSTSQYAIFQSTPIVPPPPIVSSFTISTKNTKAGDPTVLSWVTVGATVATIDQGIGTVATSGSMTVNPTVTTPYTLTITGPGGIVTVTVTVTVTPAVLPPTITAVVNGASFISPCTAGSFCTLYASGLDTAITASQALPLPIQLGGTQVLVNAKAAPLIYVSPAQINFQVPWEATGNTTTFQVIGPKSSSAAVTVALTNAPGLFTSQGYAIVQYPGSAPVVGQSGSPVAGGEIIVVYATGLGPVDCPVLTGLANLTACNTLKKTTVMFDNQEATVLYSGLTPGFPGLYQINLVVPGLPPGNMASARASSQTVVVNTADGKAYGFALISVLQ